MILPADHQISDVGEFRRVLSLSVEAAAAGALVTFGITPDRAESGYGYIEAASKEHDTAVEVVSFIEKPIG